MGRRLGARVNPHLTRTLSPPTGSREGQWGRPRPSPSPFNGERAGVSGDSVAADVRRRKAGIGRGPEDRRPRTEDGGLKTEHRGQRSEDRRLKAEDGAWSMGRRLGA